MLYLLHLSFGMVNLIFLSQKCADLCFYSLKISFKQSILLSLWKKARQLKKGMLPPVVALVTIKRYDVGHPLAGHSVWGQFYLSEIIFLCFPVPSFLSQI